MLTNRTIKATAYYWKAVNASHYGAKLSVPSRTQKASYSIHFRWYTATDIIIFIPLYFVNILVLKRWVYVQSARYSLEISYSLHYFSL